MVQEEDQQLSPEEKQALESLKKTEGWKVLKSRVIPSKVRSLERTIARQRFDNILDVYIAQSIVKAYDNIINLVENTPQQG